MDKTDLMNSDTPRHRPIEVIERELEVVIASRKNIHLAQFFARTITLTVINSLIGNSILKHYISSLTVFNAITKCTYNVSELKKQKKRD